MSHQQLIPGSVAPRGSGAHRDRVWVPGGSFVMGSDHHYPEEAPARTVAVAGFWIDRVPVTNAAADYPGADPALLVPASVVFAGPPHPYGPRTTVDGLDLHPVVHIGYDDAVAYAAWAGGELPTETQWEYAARGATSGEYAWGDEFTPAGRHMANTWQGEFPLVNLATDGYGLHDTIGNVWEWTSDWYARPAAQTCHLGFRTVGRSPA